MKPQTWPENAWPTAEQWLDWLLSLDREDQLDVAERAVEGRQAAHQCVIADHEGAVEQVAQMGQRTLDAYNQGWNDGLRKLDETYRAALTQEDA